MRTTSTQTAPVENEITYPMMYCVDGEWFFEDPFYDQYFGLPPNNTPIHQNYWNQIDTYTDFDDIDYDLAYEPHYNNYDQDLPYEPHYNNHAQNQDIHQYVLDHPNEYVFPPDPENERVTYNDGRIQYTTPSGDSYDLGPYIPPPPEEEESEDGDHLMSFREIMEEVNNLADSDDDEPTTSSHHYYGCSVPREYCVGYDKRDDDSDEYDSDSSSDTASNASCFYS